MRGAHSPAMSPRHPRPDISVPDRSSPATNRPTRHTLVRLQREWRRLTRSPQALAAARSWSLRVVPFESLDDLLAATGHGCTDRPADHDDAVLAVWAAQYPMPSEEAGHASAAAKPLYT